MDRNYDVITFISNILYLKPRVVKIADIIKITTMITKTIFKDSEKVKKIRAHSLVVSNLRSEIKGFRFEFNCWLCVKVGSLQ